MTAKEKAVGKRMRAGVREDVVEPKKRSGGPGDTVYNAEHGLRQRFLLRLFRRRGLLLNLEVRLPCG